MISPRMTRTADGRSYRVEFPFDQGVVDALKRIVPGHSRTFNPDERAWYVAPAFKDLVHQLLADVFIDVEVSDFGRHESRRAEPDTGPRTSYTVLHLRETAPPELVDAAYKCLAQLHHPDRGGDTQTMQRLNAAHAALTKG
jgi:hypothetical protein